jgi:hypothetical protein
MYGSKIKLLDELMEHLGDSQGNDLKSMLDESKMPAEGEMELGEDGKPKGLKIESVEIMGKKPEIDDVAVADAANDPKKKTLGETIGYPGFEKKKPTAMLEEGMSDMLGEKELDDEELAELLSKYV